MSPNVLRGGESESEHVSKTFFCPIQLSSQSQKIWKQMSPRAQQRLISRAQGEVRHKVAISFESHLNQEVESEISDDGND